MSDVEWAQHTDEEVIQACTNPPRIFGPWEPWALFYGGPGYAWSRHEVFPGPSYKSGGSVSVQRHYPSTLGYGVRWWDGEERSAGNFQTPEEAMAYGDAWLIGAGHRLQSAPCMGAANVHDDLKKGHAQ
jgi:hypothetical protein